MQVVDQAFLLGLAGVAGTLLGTFVVGVFFYIDSEMHMRLEVSEAADRYQRSSIRWVFTAYSIAVFVPLALAALHPVWSAVTFGLLGVLLVAMTIDCVRRILAKGASASRALVVNQWLTSVVLVLALILPWALGGWVPPPGAFVPSLLLLLASGFASTAALIMAQFDATMGMVEESTAKKSPADGTDSDQELR